MRQLGFPLLYLGWAWLFWSPIPGSGESVWSFPNIVYFLIGGASPLLAGTVMAAWTGGREGVHDLWRRLTDWRRVGRRWWILIIVFWPLFNLVMAATALVAGITERPLEIDTGLIREPGRFAFLLLLSFIFPAVEEVGLRGYYLDALQQRLGATPAGLVNGITWAAWHAPFVWFPGYYANTTFQPSLFWWLPMIVCTTLMITWVYNHTRGSILAVLLFHGMMNLTGEWLGISPDMYPFLLSGYVLVAAILVLTRQTGPAVTARRQV